MTFEWRYNGQRMPGRTSMTLPLVNIQSTDAGDYSVSVSNEFGSVTSQPARLALHPTFPAMLQPIGGFQGAGFRFAVEVEPGRDYRIQTSTDLDCWTDLHLFFSTGTAYEFSDPPVLDRPHRFYRVVSP